MSTAYQSQTIVDQSINKFEDYGQSDEDEIIKFMEKAKLDKRPNGKQIMQTSSSNKQDKLLHDFVKCLAKSPELMMSDAKNNLLHYDSAIRELQNSFVNTSTAAASHKHGYVTNVIVESQQPHQHQQQYIQQHHQQYQQHIQQTQKHHDQYQQMINQVNQTQYTNDQISKTNMQNAYNQQQMQQQRGLINNDFSYYEQPGNNGLLPSQEMPEDYIKVPVRDLISTFEKQTKEEEEKIKELNEKRPKPVKMKPLTQHQSNQYQQAEYEKSMEQIKEKNEIRRDSLTQKVDQTTYVQPQQYQQQISNDQQNQFQQQQINREYDQQKELQQQNRQQQINQFQQQIYQTYDQQQQNQHNQYQKSINDQQIEYEQQQQQNTQFNIEHDYRYDHQQQHQQQKIIQQSYEQKNVSSKIETQQYKTYSEHKEIQQQQQHQQEKIQKEENSESLNYYREERSSENNENSFRKFEDLYVPKEIPLDSYVPPPLTEKYLPQRNFPIYQSASPNVVPLPSSMANNESQPQYNFPIKKAQQLPSNYYQAASPSHCQRPPFAKLNNQSWSTHQQQSSAAQSSPIAFNPSPLPYEKLAKFEQPEPINDMYPIRRPLAVPAAGGIVRNVSPTPYGVSKQFQSSYPPTSPLPQLQQNLSTSPYATPTPSRPTSQLYSNDFKPYNTPSHHSYNPYNDESSQSVSSRVSSVDLSHCQNFNTAARGWGKNKNAYRPITFVKQPIVADLPYTDF